MTWHRQPRSHRERTVSHSVPNQRPVDPQGRNRPVAREGFGEALIKGRIGQPLNRERLLFWEPTPRIWRKATHPGASSRAPGRPGVVRDPGMCRRSLYGNREISRSTVRQPPPRAARLASRRHTQGGSRVQDSCPHGSGRERSVMTVPTALRSDLTVRDPGCVHHTRGPPVGCKCTSTPAE